MRSALFAILVFGAGASLARAEVVPSAGSRDPRMRVVAYDASNVVKVMCAPGRSTSIELGAEETVATIAVGDDKAWVVAPAGNRIFIVPDDSGGSAKPSNMQVVSRKPDGTTRLYQFDLVVVQPEVAMAGVRVVYPEEAREQRVKAWQKEREEKQARIAEDRLQVDYFYGPRNWRFVARGSPEVEPTEVSDNGQATAFRFASVNFPAIYTGRCGDKEATSNVTVRNDLLIAQAISEFFCLRKGDKVTEVKNVGYNPVGYHPMTGTTSPEVVRTIKGGRR